LNVCGPGVAQIEYRYRNSSAVWITLCFTPETADATHVFTTLYVSGRWAPCGPIVGRAADDAPRRADAVMPGKSTSPLLEKLDRIIRADPCLMELLKIARDANLPQWRLVAGCIYQTVWNSLTGRAVGTGINDYDLIYFDGTDLSLGTEAATENRIRSSLPAFAKPVEVCNQARVHLWFEDYFGVAYAPLSSADEAITRYASTTHAVGVRLTPDDRLDVFAPFGLEDIFNMVIAPNYALPNKATHEKKAARAQAIWPELRVKPWED
jgi:hypothetical protein